MAAREVVDAVLGLLREVAVIFSCHGWKPKNEGGAGRASDGRRGGGKRGRGGRDGEDEDRRRSTTDTGHRVSDGTGFDDDETASGPPSGASADRVHRDWDQATQNPAGGRHLARRTDRRTPRSRRRLGIPRHRRPRFSSRQPSRSASTRARTQRRHESGHTAGANGRDWISDATLPPHIVTGSPRAFRPDDKRHRCESGRFGP